MYSNKSQSASDGGRNPATDMPLVFLNNEIQHCFSFWNFDDLCYVLCGNISIENSNFLI